MMIIIGTTIGTNRMISNRLLLIITINYYCNNYSRLYSQFFDIFYHYSENKHYYYTVLVFFFFFAQFRHCNLV